MSFTPEQERLIEQLVDTRVQRLREEQRERMKNVQQELSLLYTQIQKFQQTTEATLTDVKRMTEVTHQTYSERMLELESMHKQFQTSLVSKIHDIIDNTMNENTDVRSNMISKKM